MGYCHMIATYLVFKRVDDMSDFNIIIFISVIISQYVIPVMKQISRETFQIMIYPRLSITVRNDFGKLYSY
jgi:hypothetical protein